MNKTILYICPDYPYPPNAGSKIDMHGKVIHFVHLGWTVVVAVVVTEHVKRQGIQQKPPEWPNVEYFEILIKDSQNIADEETIKKLQRLIEIYTPAVVWCEYARFAPAASKLRLMGAMLYFSSHNFELFHFWEKSIDHYKNSKLGFRIFRWFAGLFLEAAKIAFMEKKMHRIAHAVFYISCKDMHYMKRLYDGKCRKYWLPPLMKRQAIPVKLEKKVLDVIYLGSNFSNNVNMEGARRLLFEIIPVVQNALPDAFCFHIVGKSGKEFFRRYASESVVIHDFIHDLDAFLPEMDIACIPNSIGWGCKIKMIEALAAGMPVIGSPQAFRGIPPVAAAYFECSTNAEYVDAFKKLLYPDIRKLVSQNGKSVYELWRKNGESILTEALNEALGIT